MDLFVACEEPSCQPAGLFDTVGWTDPTDKLVAVYEASQRLAPVGAPVPRNSVKHIYQLE